MVNHQVLRLLDHRQLVPMLKLYGQAFTLVVRPKRRMESGMVSAYTVAFQKTDSNAALPEKVVPGDKDSGMVDVSRMWLSHMLDVGIVHRAQHLVGLSFQDVE